MNRLRQAAILLDLSERLRKRGSWCGETHIQKATYFLQELLNAPIGFNFILYKHGPFSFDLRDMLTAMRADGLLELVPQDPYGPSFVPTNQGLKLRKLYPKTLGKFKRKIEFVSDTLADKNVSELEKLATALFVALEEPSGSSVERRAQLISELKPHVDLADAERAVKLVDRIRADARRLRSN